MRAAARRMLRCVPALAAAVLVSAALAVVASAQEDPPRPPSLKSVPVPEPADLADFVRDRAAAIALGKSLFWDMQVGSDGVQACATCHFQAGIDTRSRHQLNPGTRRVGPGGAPDPDREFSAGRDLDHALTAADFPLSPASNDVVSSQGIAYSLFQGLIGRGLELLLVQPDPDGFRIDGVNLRRVEPRNAPSVINAVFNFRSFWDGRADNSFNGVNGFGRRDPDARVYRALRPSDPLPVRVDLEDSSLASQALSPPLNDVEMSAHGRTLAELGVKLARGGSDLGRHLRNVRPLAKQLVDRSDSVLGRLSAWPRPGLRSVRYDTLVRRAFDPSWWRSSRLVRVAADGSTRVVRRQDHDAGADDYTLMQYNFGLFFGIAIQMYEATLVADDTPYDRFMDGDATAIGDLALRGVDLFRSQTRGRCINCHEGAELTGASVRRVREAPVRIRENQALDRGFNNIGVLPRLEDLGVGGGDAFGPLSTVRVLSPPPAEPIAVDGAMKVPGLRNVELTAPYFHNGGQLTLRDVLRFYSRGGDVHPQLSADGALEIAPLNVLDNSEEEIDAFEAFLLSLTDERVRFQRAPFDHPQLFVPDGPAHAGASIVDAGNGVAADEMIEIPAVGRDGGTPLPRFLE